MKKRWGKWLTWRSAECTLPVSPCPAQRHTQNSPRPPVPRPMGGDKSSLLWLRTGKDWSSEPSPLMAEEWSAHCARKMSSASQSLSSFRKWGCFFFLPPCQGRSSRPAGPLTHTVNDSWLYIKDVAADWEQICFQTHMHLELSASGRHWHLIALDI